MVVSLQVKIGLKNMMHSSELNYSSQSIKGQVHPKCKFIQKSFSHANLKSFVVH